MKTILFPTDFSSHSLNALDYACHFADEIGAELTLLHIYPLPLVSANLSKEQWKVEKELVHKSRLKQLQDFYGNYIASKKSSGLERFDVEFDLVANSTLNGLMNYVKESDPDLVIMGTLGIYGHAKGMDKIVTCEVIDTNIVDVLVIPDGYSYSPPTKLLVAVDHDSANSQSIDIANSSKKGL